MCWLGTISLTGETYWGGLASILSAKCSGCQTEMANFIKGSQAKWVTAMGIGGGHAPLVEVMSVLGIPVMSKKSFIAMEK